MTLIELFRRAPFFGCHALGFVNVKGTALYCFKFCSSRQLHTNRHVVCTIEVPFHALLFFSSFSGRNRFNRQVRHFKDFHGVTTKNVKEVAPKVKKEYQSYAPYQVCVCVCVGERGKERARETEGQRQSCVCFVDCISLSRSRTYAVPDSRGQGMPYSRDCILSERSPSR